VQRPTPLAHAGAQFDQGCNLVKLTAVDALGDADQILRDHPAGAQVEVTDLAVSHLSFGKADGEAARIQEGPRRRLPESMPDRSGGQLDRVAFRFGTVAPAIEHHQDDPFPGKSV
jgi:hypothetical protein